MKKDLDYKVDEKLKAIQLTDEGINKAEQLLGIENIYTEKGIKYVHHLETAVKAQAIYEKPTVIIAHTIPGKGVDFMENDYKWHGTPPDLQDVDGAPPKGQQAKTALNELRTLQGQIESEHQS